MPILKNPLVPIDTQEILIANEILNAAGSPSALLKSEMQSFLEEEGLSKRELAKQLSVLARHSDNESVRLHSIRTALELHGELNTKKENEDRPVVINIGGTNQVNQIFNPKRI